MIDIESRSIEDVRSPLPRAVLIRLETGRTVVFSVIVGILVGIACIPLRLILDFMIFWGTQITGFSAPGTLGEGGLMMAFGDPIIWAVVFLPIFGGLYTTFIPAALGAPYTQLVRVTHRKNSILKREQFQTLAATLFAHGSGLLVGRDSAYALIGQSITQLLSLTVRLDPAELRVLLLAGAAAGLGTVLHAPLVAAVLIAEILYRRFEFEFEALMPCILAAVAAYAVYGLRFGFGPLLEVPAVQMPAGGQFLAYLGIALTISVAGWLLMLACRLIPTSWTDGKYRPLLGALYGGVMAMMLLQVTPVVLGDGMGWLGLGLSGFLSVEALESGIWRWILLALGARLAFGGGVFPSVAAGGLLGVGLGSLFGLDPTLAGLIGATAFMTVTLNTPLSATLLAVAWGGDAALPMALISAGLAHLISGESGMVPDQASSRASIRTFPEVRLPPLRKEDTVAIPFDQGPKTGEKELYRRTVPVRWQGTRLKLLTLPSGVELIGIFRSGHVQLPHPDLRLTAEDELILLATSEDYQRFESILRLSG